MSESRPRALARRHRRLRAGRPGARRGGRAGAPPRWLRGMPRRAALAAAGGRSCCPRRSSGSRPPAELRARIIEQVRAEPAPGAAAPAAGALRPRQLARAGGRSPASAPSALIAGRGRRLRDPRRRLGRRGATTVAAGKRARRDREDGHRGRLGDPAPRQRPPAARRTRCSRPGCSATARSSRSRRCSSPTARAGRRRRSPTCTASKP